MSAYGKTVAVLVTAAVMALVKALAAIGVPAFDAQLGTAGWDIVTAGATAYAVYRWPNAARPLPGDGNATHA